MTLIAITRALASEDFELIRHLPENPLTFVRGGDGLVGFGQALKLSARGENRIQDLADQWRSASADAQVDNPLSIAGTGLVAFGSFAFSATSEAESVLIVPQILLGKRDGRLWLTEIKNVEQASNTHVGSITNDEVATEPNFWNAPQVYRQSAVELTDGEFSADDFKAGVADAVERISRGELKKVVVARDQIGRASADFDIRSVLQKLAQRFDGCWVYSVDGTFGASPELLVRVAHGQVSARVLAGTAGRGTDPGVDRAIAAALAASAKNLEEHSYAVDSLVGSLSPFCAQIDADPMPFSLALPNVWHLASDVHGVLKSNSNALDLAAALHPTAAVAGTPTDIAQSVIEEIEGFDRGRYAGPVGWIGADGDGEWAIALRGGQIKELNDGSFEIRAYAGCGIVGESDPDAELAETKLKLSPVRVALR